MEVSIRLGVDPKKADQIVRGTVALPHGTGKTVRVLAITKTKQRRPKRPARTWSGFEDVIEKIKGGWTDMDVIVATPEAMPEIGKLGKILGPRGLMPNPKAGTVTPNIGSSHSAKSRPARWNSAWTSSAFCISVSAASPSPSSSFAENLAEFFRNVMRLKPAIGQGPVRRSRFT